VAGGGQHGNDGPTPREIEEALRGKIDMLVPQLLTGAIRDGAFWCAGSVAGEPGQSLKVNRTGSRRGVWTDFSAAEGTDEYSGDMLKLIAVVHFGGWSRGNEARSSAIKWAKGFLGWDNIDRDKLQKVRRDADARQAAADEAARVEAEGKLKSANAMWHGAVAIADTPAEAYLRGRGIDFARLGRVPASLRYLPDCWCSIRRSKHPAMVACIMALDGSLLGVHRTYLDVSNGKAGSVGAVKIVRDDASKKFRIATAADRAANARLKSHKLSLGDYAGGCIPLWKGACGKTLREIDAGNAGLCQRGDRGRA
jgi:hypothetical protein